METITNYVVQAWVEGYEYWANTAELPENMFSLPVSGYEDEEPARARLNALREVNPKGRYRLIRQVTTSQEI